MSIVVVHFSEFEIPFCCSDALSVSVLSLQLVFKFMCVSSAARQAIIEHKGLTHSKIWTL